MRKWLAAALFSGVAASCTSTANEPSSFAASLKPVAVPGEVIAAELAFARAARTEGQWTAFAKFAANDAVMFVPQAVLAKDWLKGRANPAKAVAWQSHNVWLSCDGSLAVTKGAWQGADGSFGDFTTVWQRQGGGKYRWLMDQGRILEEPLEAPEMISAIVADCSGAPKSDLGADLGAERVDRADYGSISDDSTLYWNVQVKPDNSRKVTAHYWDGDKWQPAFSAEFFN